MKQFSLIISLMLSNSLVAQVDFWPAYQDVVSYYFTHYLEPEEGDEGWRLHFSRQPDGYYAEIVSYVESPAAVELLYHFETEDYRALSDKFQRRSAASGSRDEHEAETTWRIENYLAQNGHHIVEFDNLPFYGYKDYDKDVIALYEQSDWEPSAWEMHALGRAYSKWAAELLHEHAASAGSGDSTVRPATRGALSEEHISAFIALAEKAIAAYHKTIALDPDFITPTGPVKTKYANEVMHTFMSLLYHQNEAAARRVVLRKDIYDPYLLQMGRNWLNTCLPNSVLFTHGDTDTYPLYYLQAAETLRTDVIIVNLTMALSPLFLQMVYEGPLGAQHLKTGLPAHFFEKIAYCPVDEVESTNSILPIEALFLTLSDTLRYEYSLLSPEIQTIPLPSLSYRLRVPSGITGIGGATVDEISLSNPGSYMLSDRIFMLDLLEANAWRRPVYFAPTVYLGSYPEMAEYLVWEGLLWRFHPREASDIQSSPFRNILEMPINRERSAQLWSEIYRFDTTERSTQPDKISFHQTALLGSMRLLTEFQNLGDNEHTLAFAQQLMQHFPDRQNPWGAGWPQIASAFAKAGDIAAAEEILLKVFDNCTQNRLTGHGDVVVIRELACTLANEWDMKEAMRKCEGR